MTIEVIQLGKSDGGQDGLEYSSRATLEFLVKGAWTLADARSAVSAEVPTTYDGLNFNSLSRDYIGNGCWEFRAEYNDKKQDTGDYTFSFDTTGGTSTKKIGYSTTRYGTNTPDFKGLINVNDKDVDGVDVTIPAFKFDIKKRQPQATITLAYMLILYALTGKTNNATFLGFAAGELLFLGASGGQGTESDPEITYSFLASPNVTGLTVGGISGIAKTGHQYLWAYYEPTEDATAKKTIPNPTGIYIETVYQAGNFATLGI